MYISSKEPTKTSRKGKNVKKNKTLRGDWANLLFVKSKADQSDFYGAFHLARKSEFRARNDVTYELTTFDLYVGKARWMLLLALLAHTHV